MHPLEYSDEQVSREAFKDKVVAVMRAVESRLNEYNDSHCKLILAENLLNGELLITASVFKFTMKVIQGNKKFHVPDQVAVFFSDDPEDDEMFGGPAPIMNFPIMQVEIDKMETWYHLYAAFTHSFTVNIVRELLQFSTQFPTY